MLISPATVPEVKEVALITPVVSVALIPVRKLWEASITPRATIFPTLLLKVNVPDELIVRSPFAGPALFKFRPKVIPAPEPAV